MVKQIGKAIKWAHAITMWTAFFVTIGSLSVFLYEQSKSFEDYIKYFHVIPYKVAYDNGDDIKFHSFYESYVEVDIEWGETVWCDDGNGFVHTDTASTNEKDFLVNRQYPENIRSIMIEIYNNNHEATSYTEQILRDYAAKSQEEGFTEGSKIGAWRLNIEKPRVGSICYTRHKIRIKTPYFKLEKNYELFSSPWTYGRQDL